MTKILEPVDKQATTMDAVTELTPRVVILTPHPDCVITAPLQIVRARSHLVERRAPTRRLNNVVDTRARKTPAPLGLRLFVSMLLFVLLASTGGVVAQGTHPKWFIRFEHYIRSDLRVVPASHAQLLDHAVLVSSSPAAVTYALPATPYSVVVSADHPCWFIVKSTAGGSTTIKATTMLPSTSPMSIPIRGSSSIMVAARTQSIVITTGLKVLGVIRSPRVGVVYSFIPRP